MESLGAPVLTNQLHRQTIEQFWMRWQVSCFAEVAKAFDDSLAEVVLPKAVHKHPRRQRLLGLCHKCPVNKRFRHPNTLPAWLRTALGRSWSREMRRG